MRPLGRRAKEGHLNKTGQSWRSDITREYDDRGMLVSVTYNGPKVCPDCGEVIRFDSHGWAFCRCNIFNDPFVPTTIDEKRRDRVHKINRFRKTHSLRFIRGCRY